jgi:hypothetical protein
MKSTTVYLYEWAVSQLLGQREGQSLGIRDTMGLDLHCLHPDLKAEADGS